MNPHTLNRVKAEVSVMLANYPELVSDDDLRHAILDGQTDFYETLSILARELAEAEEMEEANARLVNRFKERKERFAHRQERIKATMLQLMELAGETKAKLPEGSVSVRYSRKVLVTDAAALPAAFVEVEIKPKKTAIKAAIKEGQTIEGATLSNPAPYITII